VFVFGVAALLGVWFTHPLFPDTAEHRLDRALTAARQLLARPDGNADKAYERARRACELAEGSDRMGEAELMLGTALMRQAERASAEKVPALWQQAREHLEIAEEQGVPESDRMALQYRLGKVNFRTGAPLAQVIKRLEEATPHVDNRAEGYGILTQAYLQLPEPDLARALEANCKLRNVADATEEELSAAKLLGGELLMRLGRAEEARNTWKKITAPPAVRGKARLLLARSYQQEGKWEDAATRYEKALSDGAAPLADPARVRYDLALCYQQRGMPAEAAKKWEECVKSAAGEEGPAAALHLARLLLSDAAAEPEPGGAPEKGRDAAGARAMEMLTLAVDQVHKPSEWKNTLADLKLAREVFETAAEKFREAGCFDLALRLTDAYERVALPGRAALLRGEFSAESARLRKQRAQKSSDPKKRKDDLEAAHALYRKAGVAYAQAAGRPGATATQRAESLWLSATNYQAGQEHAQTVEQFKRYLEVEKRPNQLGEGNYRLGEALRSTGKTDAAGEAYRNAMESSPTGFGYLARLRLAEAALEAGDLDEAEAALVLNIKLIRFDPHPEALERSLFALGSLLYQRRNFRGAMRNLEEGLERFKTNPEAIKVRYQLADCYRQIAAQENQRSLLSEKLTEEARDHFQNEHHRWLQKAAQEFTELGKILDSPAGQGQLTREQRTQVPFIAAKCWFDKGEYNTALDLYKGLIERHAGKVEALEALGHAVGCHAAMGQPDMVRQRLLEIEQMLPSMSIDESVRKAWQAWVKAATRGLEQL
jgi:tetratricopeptide (TPR) repeat protein